MIRKLLVLCLLTIAVTAFQPPVSNRGNVVRKWRQPAGHHQAVHRTSFRRPPPFLLKATASGNADVVTQFLQSFWKGVTLPFPTLRRLVVNSGSRSRTFSIGLSFREGLVALTLYLSCGVLAYSFLLEKWSLIDALYFSCVTFCTVGYGDVCPTNAASKVFTCLYGVGGIAGLGTVLATVGGKVVQAEQDALQKAQQKSKSRLSRLFEGMPNALQQHRQNEPTEVFNEELSKRSPEPLDATSESEKPLWLRILGGILKVLPSSFLIFGGSALVQYLNGSLNWFGVDSLYLGLITASTIGFGDMSPQTASARTWAVVYVPLAVAAAGELLSQAATALIQWRQCRVYEEQLQSGLTLQHLEAMDADENGQVSREEYIQFMLMEMGLVSTDEILELTEQFERLDVTKSGHLDKDDLRKMAELRGAKVVRTRNGKEQIVKEQQ